MSFFELLKNRRSIRQYTNRQVEPEKIKKIMTAALMSPASRHSNAWQFIVVEDQETLKLLSESRQGSSQFLAGAPLGIVVLVDKNKSTAWVEDGSIAAVIMQLQAEELGLGSCWIQVNGRNKDADTTTEEYIRGVLSIPETFSVLCMIAAGYKNEIRNPHEIENLDYNKIHSGRFENK